MRFIVVLLGILFALPPAATAANPEQAIAGLWTHLLIKGRPDEPRRLPMIYQDKRMSSEEAVRTAAAEAVAVGAPVVLNLEHHPTKRLERWWLDPNRDSPEVFSRAEDYCISRLAAAQSVGATAALWSRPSQNAMLHIWKPGRPDLRSQYRTRWEAAERVLPLQDFVTIQLYLPKGQRPYVDRGFPLVGWKKRGEWFVRHARENRKAPMLFISPTWGGTRSGYVPAEWLENVTTHFLNADVSVCIWGGQGKVWDDSDPMCQALRRLMVLSGQYTTK